MEFGVYTFVETRLDPNTGEPVDLDKTFAECLEQIELADRVGLDVFGLGEHHRPDYVRWRGNFARIFGPVRG